MNQQGQNCFAIIIKQVKLSINIVSLSGDHLRSNPLVVCTSDWLLLLSMIQFQFQLLVIETTSADLETSSQRCFSQNDCSGDLSLCASSWNSSSMTTNHEFMYAYLGVHSSCWSFSVTFFLHNACFYVHVTLWYVIIMDVLVLLHYIDMYIWHHHSLMSICPFLQVWHPVYEYILTVQCFTHENWCSDKWFRLVSLSQANYQNCEG